MVSNNAVSMCGLVVAVIGLVLMVYGFYMIFQNRKALETEVEVLHRQLRGFATLMIAQLTIVIGLGACGFMYKNEK